MGSFRVIETRGNRHEARGGQIGVVLSIWGRPRDEIGFVSHNGGWGSQRDGRGTEIGFVSHNWAWENGQDVGGTRIGFPDKSGLTFGQRGRLAAGWGLGSFRIFWSSTGPLRVRLGSFRIFWSSTGSPRWKLGSFRRFAGLRLGSFRIIQHLVLSPQYLAGVVGEPAVLGMRFVIGFPPG